MKRVDRVLKVATLVSHIIQSLSNILDAKALYNGLIIHRLFAHERISLSADAGVFKSFDSAIFFLYCQLASACGRRLIGYRKGDRMAVYGHKPCIQKAFRRSQFWTCPRNHCVLLVASGSNCRSFGKQNTCPGRRNNLLVCLAEYLRNNTRHGWLPFGNCCRSHVFVSSGPRRCLAG